MRLRRLSIILVAVAAAAVTVPQAMAATKPPQVKGFFGAGLTFDVKKGKKTLSTGSNGAMSLKAGAYRFVFKDDSSIHNYRLINSGGGTIKGKVGKKNKNVLTKVSRTRAKPFTYTVALKEGTYTLVCDPHLRAGMTVEIVVK